MNPVTVREWSVRSDLDKIPNAPKPDILTPEQSAMIIDLIMDKIVVNGPSQKANNQMRDNIRDEISRQMHVCITSDPDALTKLVSGVVNRYNTAKVPDGEAVGLLAPTSIASATTQATMKTFSLASGASVAVEGGLAGLTTLIYTRLTRKNDARMVVHFNTPVDRMDIVSMRQVLVEVNVNDLVVSHRIGILAPTIGTIYPGQLERFWWHNLQRYDPQKTSILASYQGESYVLRLFLDIDMMYAHHVTPSKIANAIQTVIGSSILCMASIFADGMIDILLLPSYVKGNPTESYEQIHYLNRIIFSNLKTIKLKGVFGISNVFPKTYPLTDLIINERKISPTNYIIEIGRKNHAVFEGIFVPYHRLEDQFRNHSIDIVRRIYHKHNNKLIGYEVSSFQSPKKLIGDVEYTYAITTGSNFDAIVKIPWVDPLRTVPNNIFEIYSKIGVEASREYFVYELTLVLESVDSSDINSRHVDLTTDTIYIQGKPAGATYIGNISRGQGPFTQAASERGGDAMIKAAQNRVTEKARATTPSILLGGFAEIGREARLAKSTPESIAIIKSRIQDMKDKKAVVLRETNSIKNIVTNFNRSIRNALTYGRDISETYQPVPSMSIVDNTVLPAPQPKTETAIVTADQPIESEYYPSSTPYILEKVLNKLPTVVAADPPRIAVSEVIQPPVAVTNMNVFPSLQFYEKLFDIRIGAAEHYNRTFITDTINKYISIVKSSESIPSVPQPEHDINVYSRKLVETSDVITIDVPVDTLRGRENLKPVVHAPHLSSTIYSNVMNNPIPIDEISKFLPFIEPRPTYTVIPIRMT